MRPEATKDLSAFEVEDTNPVNPGAVIAWQAPGIDRPHSQPSRSAIGWSAFNSSEDPSG